MYLIVDVFRIVAFIGKEGAFRYRKKRMRISQNIQGNRRIMDISGCCDLKNRESGNTIYKNMVFITPVEFIFLFI